MGEHIFISHSSKDDGIVSSQKVAVEQKINEKHRHCYRSSNKGKLS